MAAGSNSSDSRLVYTTEEGRVCPECSHAIQSCTCRKGKKTANTKASSAVSVPNGKSRVEDGVVRLRREVKGRGGKTVTTISGVPGGGATLEELAKRLKKRCGTGGTVRDGVIEIQGDHRDTISAELQKAGFTVKLAGG